MNFTKPKTQRYNVGTKNKLNDNNHICQIKTPASRTASNTANTTSSTANTTSSTIQSLKSNMIFCKTPKVKCSQCS